MNDNDTIKDVIEDVIPETDANDAIIVNPDEVVDTEPGTKGDFSNTCFVFVSTDDEMVNKHRVPKGTREVRVFAYDHLPLFYLMCGKTKVGDVSPTEMLYALGEGRVNFLRYEDQVEFAHVLNNALTKSDRIKKTSKKVAFGAGMAVGAAMMAASAMVIVAAAKKILK